MEEFTKVSGSIMSRLCSPSGISLIRRMEKVPEKDLVIDRRERNGEIHRQLII